MKRKIIFLFEYFKYLKNPISCLLFKFGIKKKINIKPKKTNKIIETNNQVILNNLMAILPYHERINDEIINFIDELNSKNKIINWAGVKIFNYSEKKEQNIWGVFIEYFKNEYWCDFNIDFNNKTVIDIGSNIGDSSLYFAGQGAEVYGFEPVKHLYEISNQLKEINPLIENKLHFFNMGISDKKGKITIDQMDSTSLYSNDEIYDVEVTTLSNAIEKYNIKPDILKMDCEGCEYNIILNTDLSDFNHIILEHHAKMVGKSYDILINKLLSEGFKIDKLKLMRYNFKEMGLIHAYK